MANALLSGTAHAQRFFPLLPPNPRDRLQVASYLADWELPSLPQTVSLGQPGSFTLVPGVGPLVTMDYFVRRYVSVGGWWNRLSSPLSFREEDRTVDQKVADTVADFWDVHASYYFPERHGNGWSVQIGYSTLRYDVDFLPILNALGKSDDSLTLHSPNIWINRTQRVGIRRVGGRRRSIRMFSSLGYHRWPEFGGGLDLMLGGTVPLSRRLNVSASVWFSHVRGTSTRATVGMAGSF